MSMSIRSVSHMVIRAGRVVMVSAVSLVMIKGRGRCTAASVAREESQLDAWNNLYQTAGVFERRTSLERSKLRGTGSGDSALALGLFIPLPCTVSTCPCSKEVDQKPMPRMSSGNHGVRASMDAPDAVAWSSLFRFRCYLGAPSSSKIQR